MPIRSFISHVLFCCQWENFMKFSSHLFICDFCAPSTRQNSSENFETNGKKLLKEGAKRKGKWRKMSERGTTTRFVVPIVFHVETWKSVGGRVLRRETVAKAHEQPADDEDFDALGSELQTATWAVLTIWPHLSRLTTHRLTQFSYHDPPTSHFDFLFFQQPSMRFSWPGCT